MTEVARDAYRPDLHKVMPVASHANIKFIKNGSRAGAEILHLAQETAPVITPKDE